MRRIIIFAFAMALAGACGPTIKPAERPRFSNGSNHLTLSIYDGLTGAPVEGATVKMQIGPYMMDAASEGNLYNLTQIPQGTFTVFIEKDGYLGFLGTVDSTVLTSTAVLTDPGSMTYQSRTVLLYPEKIVPADVVVRVFEEDSGKPVTGGTVVAQLVTGGTHFISFAGATQLPGEVKLRPNVIVATIGAEGTAVLPKDQLILGGAYKIGTYGAVDSLGRFLSPADSIDHTVSENFPQVNIFIGPPATTPIALSASNEAGGVQQTLSVEFPYPVEVCGDSGIHRWTNTTGIDTNGNGILAAPAAINPVTVSINSGTLTLTPQFGSGNSAFDSGDNLAINFTGIEIQVVGTDDCVSLGEIKLRNSSVNVSTAITYNKP